MPEPYKRKVCYYETDQMGIVHHSNYARWFEEARLDYLEQVGLDYHRMEQEGVASPVLACSCRHNKPVRFPQEFTIVATLKEFNGVRFRVGYVIYVPESKAPVAFGETEHCFVNAQMHPTRIQKKYPEIFKGMKELLPLEKVEW